MKIAVDILRFQLQGPVLGDDAPEPDANNVEWTEPDNETIAELENRAVHVQNVCRKRSLPTKSINSKEFFVDHTHSLVWCNIFKAASSSWLYKFNILGKIFHQCVCVFVGKCGRGLLYSESPVIHCFLINVLYTSHALHAKNNKRMRMSYSHYFVIDRKLCRNGNCKYDFSLKKQSCFSIDKAN